MAYPYGTQGAPAVGGGAPGLPRRTAIAQAVGKYYASHNDKRHTTQVERVTESGLSNGGILVNGKLSYAVSFYDSSGNLYWGIVPAENEGFYMATNENWTHYGPFVRSNGYGIATLKEGAGTQVKTFVLPPNGKNPVTLTHSLTPGTSLGFCGAASADGFSYICNNNELFKVNLATNAVAWSKKYTATSIIFFGVAVSPSGRVFVAGFGASQLHLLEVSPTDGSIITGKYYSPSSSLSKLQGFVASDSAVALQFGGSVSAVGSSELLIIPLDFGNCNRTYVGNGGSTLATCCLSGSDILVLRPVDTLSTYELLVAGGNYCQKVGTFSWSGVNGPQPLSMDADREKNELHLAVGGWQLVMPANGVMPTKTFSLPGGGTLTWTAASSAVGGFTTAGTASPATAGAVSGSVSVTDWSSYSSREILEYTP